MPRVHCWHLGTAVVVLVTVVSPFFVVLVVVVVKVTPAQVVRVVVVDVTVVVTTYVSTVRNIIRCGCAHSFHSSTVKEGRVRHAKGGDVRQKMVRVNMGYHDRQQMIACGKQNTPWLMLW